MPVNSTHPEYDAALPAWLRARDVMAGEDAIKRGGKKYLPRLDCQTDGEFAAYLARGSFFNATSRTADGYVGLIFRRAPFVKLPEGGSGLGVALKEFRNDADMLGTSLQVYAKKVVAEVMTVGRAGSLVDWEGDVEDRAYATFYAAEQILNWRVERVNGRNVPTLIVLAESVECAAPPVSVSEPTTFGRFLGEPSPGLRPPSPIQWARGLFRSRGRGVVDEFVPKVVEQIRVLKLVTDDVSGATPDTTRQRRVQPRCVVEVWRRGEARYGQETGDWVLYDVVTPLRRGQPLPALPFVFHGPRHSLPAVDKLPLDDVIAVNLDHYRLNADYKHGIHYTALPTAWVSGFDKEAKLQIGSSSAWTTTTVGAMAGFLEFTGTGLGTFEKAMDRDERLMAVLGSRLLAEQKRVGETADAIELRQSGENSILGNIATSVSESLRHVLRWVYWWNSTEEHPDMVGDDSVVFSLNTDFSNKGMASAEIIAVVKAWQSGALSTDSMYELFRRGDVLPDGRSNEEEKTLVAKSKPPGLTVTGKPAVSAQTDQSLLTSAATGN